MLSLQRGLDFSGSGGPSWQPKSIKNRSKFEVQDRKALGIDFSRILEGLGRQVGRENRAKIDQKSMPKKHRKNDEKKRASEGPRQREDDWA